MVFIWNNNSLPKTKKMRKAITFKNKSTSMIQPTQLRWNSFGRLGFLIAFFVEFEVYYERGK
jgi:hypothetical protein